MVVWTFLDAHASMVAQDRADEWNSAHPDQPPREPVDMEYEELEEAFRKTFPTEQIMFVRGKPPTELNNGCPDVYVWDIGGMDAGFIGRRRGDFSAEMAKQISAHPDTWFVPWSMFTMQYIEGAITDLLPEDEDFTSDKVPPNLVFLAMKQRFGMYSADVLSILTKKRHK